MSKTDELLYQLESMEHAEDWQFENGVIEIYYEDGCRPDVEISEIAKAAKERIMKLRLALRMQSVQSCNCMTKTNDHNYHHERCPYRIIMQEVMD